MGEDDVQTSDFVTPRQDQGSERAVHYLGDPGPLPEPEALEAPEDEPEIEP